MKALNTLFRKFIEKVFFKKEVATGFCLAVALISFLVEIKFDVGGLFSASGAVFTIAGLFLNIKLTAHFHLRLPSGEPLGVRSKYSMISGRSTFAGNESESEMEHRVKEVEDDEIWGAFLMVSGTLIWGYGSYVINFLIKNCL